MQAIANMHAIAYFIVKSFQESEVQFSPATDEVKQVSSRVRAATSLILIISIAAAAHAATKAKKSAIVTVPFVGCKSDGQVGPKPAPKGEPHKVKLPPAMAKQLAYYASEGLGVLAPKGWSGFDRYGSDGEILTITPAPDSNPGSKITGPCVELQVSEGGTSGRFAVAGIVARFFPHYKKYLDDVVKEGLESKSEIVGKRFASDKLTYKNDHMVEFKTPAKTNGFGTNSDFKKNAAPIYGFAMLLTSGDSSDISQAIVLRVRLQEGKDELASQIVQQSERELSQ